MSVSTPLKHLYGLHWDLNNNANLSILSVQQLNSTNNYTDKTPGVFTGSHFPVLLSGAVTSENDICRWIRCGWNQRSAESCEIFPQVSVLIMSESGRGEMGSQSQWFSPPFAIWPSFNYPPLLHGEREVVWNSRDSRGLHSLINSPGRSVWWFDHRVSLIVTLLSLTR